MQPVKPNRDAPTLLGAVAILDFSNLFDHLPAGTLP
jgi:hypothetical protein